MGEGRIAFVPVRYGDDVVGGSEAVVREAALGLAARGWEVDVLTSCAKSHYTWSNEYPAGVSRSGALTVRRFPTVVPQHSRRFGSLTLRIQAGEEVSAAEEVEWVNGLFRVPEMFHWLVAHAGDYDALVFSPYLFWPAVACSAIAPERSVVMPCLHDEPYAHLGVYQPLLAESASVWFLSEPEHQLGHRLGGLPPHHVVTGAGVDVPADYDVEGFRARYGLTRPFVLYAGRREEGKGWDWLLRAYTRAVERDRMPLDLVTIGVGPPLAADFATDRVVDLGFLDDRERDNAFAAAAVYVQPSRNESFSRTVMEAWLAGTPVVASAASDVVTWHCERSGGGLTFGDEIELEECLVALGGDPDGAAAMAAAGREYVLGNYSWPTVLDRMEAGLRVVCAPSS
ncbi:MAG TPA: glycosyltransferase family 4 protein [Acidimicrobiales bacterium]|nr:glycosyltransferase family 4 protein [Acidimicrobiales bacterium]